MCSLIELNALCFDSICCVTLPQSKHYWLNAPVYYPHLLLWCGLRCMRVWIMQWRCSEMLLGTKEVTTLTEQLHTGRGQITTRRGESSFGSTSLTRSVDSQRVLPVFFTFLTWQPVCWSDNFFLGSMFILLLWWFFYITDSSREASLNQQCKN